MTRRCIIEGCGSRSGNILHRGVTFHSFPFDSKTRELWITNCHLNPDKNITKSVLVCSRHFRKADFQPLKSSKYLLKPGSIPSIFPWSKRVSLDKLEQLDESPMEVDAVTEDLREDSQTESSSNNDPEKDKVESENSILQMVIASEQISDSAEIKAPDIPDTEMPARQAPPTGNTSKPESSVGFSQGRVLEAQDFDGNWHAASVVEVDSDEQEVLIRFEPSAKNKSSTVVEEWIPMNSSRLRDKNLQTAVKPATNYEIGDRCLARWSGSRRFPATVTKNLGNGNYEVLFDDGYTKVARGIHMSKIKQIEKGSSESPKTPSQPSKAAVTPTQKSQVKKAWPLISMKSLNLDELCLPPIPKDGEWCCYWVNDQPIGEEGFLIVGDQKKPTVIVHDWRLPPNWTKHMYQRSNVLGKWDVILVNPAGRRFRSKSDLKQYIEEIGQHYNPDVYDFSIHRRRAKDIGAYVYTKDYKVPKPNVAETQTTVPVQPTTPQLKMITTLNQPPSTPETLQMTASTLDETIIEDGYVNVGSLKVQIVDNLFRCPQENCNKSFRKENHLQIHIKHYHDDIAKLLGVCPNMQDLAYKRTIGEPLDEAVPKNHLPNAQFFAKLHQQDLQTKTRRKSLSTLAPQADSISSPNMSLVNVLPVIDKIDDANLPAPEESNIDQMNSLIDKDNNVILTTNVDDVIKDGGESKPQLKVEKETPNRKSSRQRLQKKYLNASVTRLSHSDIGGNDIEDSRHSFGGTTDTKIAKKPKLLLVPQPGDSNDTNSLSGGAMADPSQSPKYIKENGELIKIVRMRQEEIINCLCSFGEEDGLMIQCELCLCWQHGICNGIEKESQVPDKYICYICRNPQRGRTSLKYIHDQDWLYEGKLPVANYHSANPSSQVMFEKLRKTHIFTGNLLEMKRFMYSLKVKINIAKNKDHPKMYLWAKRWESSPTKFSKIDEKSLNGDHNNGSNGLRSTETDHFDSVAKNEDVEMKDIDGDTLKKECDLNEDKLFAQSKEDEIENRDSFFNNLDQSSVKTEIHLTAPTIPQPEVQIDTVECQRRLIEHLQRQNACLAERLQIIESEISDIEVGLENEDTKEVEISKTKSVLSMLIKDLETMRNIARINSN